MKIRYSNNRNKGDRYTDVTGQVWQYTPELNEDTPGRRCAFVRDEKESAVLMRQYEINAADSRKQLEETEARKREMYPILVRNLQRRVRKLGFKRVYKSKFGSTYYRKDDFVLRISDHYVPDTEERVHNRSVGGNTCCDREIVIQF